MSLGSPVIHFTGQNCVSSPAGDSYPEGNFRENKFLDGPLTGLLLIHLVPTINLNVRGALNFHQSFLQLCPDQMWIAAFEVAFNHTTGTCVGAT